MTTSTLTSQGHDFTAELRAMLHIGPRTRWYRRNRFGNLTRDNTLERIYTAFNYPGYDDTRRTEILRAGYTALNAWLKHVEGYRIDPTLRARITEQSPYAWTAYLGTMVDSGCANMAEFETWFSQQR